MPRRKRLPVPEARLLYDLLGPEWAQQLAYHLDREGLRGIGDTVVSWLGLANTKRDVFLLYFLDDLHCREVAELTGLSPTGVNRIISGIRKQFDPYRSRLAGLIELKIEDLGDRCAPYWPTIVTKYRTHIEDIEKQLEERTKERYGSRIAVNQ